MYTLLHTLKRVSFFLNILSLKGHLYINLFERETVRLVRSVTGLNIIQCESVLDFNLPPSRFKHVGGWLQEVLARQTVTGVVIV